MCERNLTKNGYEVNRKTKRAKKGRSFGEVILWPEDYQRLRRLLMLFKKNHLKRFPELHDSSAYSYAMSLLFLIERDVNEVIFSTEQSRRNRERQKKAEESAFEIGVDIAATNQSQLPQSLLEILRSIKNHGWNSLDGYIQGLESVLRNNAVGEGVV